jgi:hypothetical protein
MKNASHKLKKKTGTRRNKKNMTAKQARDLIIQMIHNAYERHEAEFLKLAQPILNGMKEKDIISEYVEVLRGRS